MVEIKEILMTLEIMEILEILLIFSSCLNLFFIYRGIRNQRRKRLQRKRDRYLDRLSNALQAREKGMK